ncbi:hypothetical protein [Virgisporangium ochraceum]|nr:hypothetical protein [Virgisporangium ochraceum]
MSDWSRFDTAAHRTAQAGCRHLIHCAVDATTRRAVAEHIDYARRVGDVSALPIQIAQLGGPCTLPPADPDAATDGAASENNPAPRTSCGDNRKDQR